MIKKSINISYKDVFILFITACLYVILPLNKLISIFILTNSLLFSFFIALTFLLPLIVTIKYEFIKKINLEALIAIIIKRFIFLFLGLSYSIILKEVLYNYDNFLLMTFMSGIYIEGLLLTGNKFWEVVLNTPGENFSSNTNPPGGPSGEQGNISYTSQDEDRRRSNSGSRTTNTMMSGGLHYVTREEWNIFTSRINQLLQDEIISRTANGKKFPLRFYNLPTTPREKELWCVFVKDNPELPNQIQPKEAIIYSNSKSNIPNKFISAMNLQITK